MTCTPSEDRQQQDDLDDYGRRPVCHSAVTAALAMMPVEGEEHVYPWVSKGRRLFGYMIFL
jgi:hypothetical protein